MEPTDNYIVDPESLRVAQHVLAEAASEVLIYEFKVRSPETQEFAERVHDYLIKMSRSDKGAAQFLPHTTKLRPYPYGFRINTIKAGRRTANGRVYPEEVLRKAVEQAQERVANNQILVFNPKDSNPESKLTDAVGVVTDLRFDGEYMTVQFNTLPQAEAFNRLPPDGVIHNVDPVMQGTVEQIAPGGPLKQVKNLLIQGFNVIDKQCLYCGRFIRHDKEYCSLEHKRAYDNL